MMIRTGNLLARGALMLDADQPISDQNEDRLDFNRYAKSLANAIGSHVHDNSLAIAIYGPWGSGKTSMMNLAIRELKVNAKQTNKTAPYVVHFNPWMWSGEEELSRVFFKEISAALTSQPGEDLGEVKARLKRYGAGFHFVKKVADAVSTASLIAGLPPVTAAARVVSSGAKAATEVAEAGADAIQDAEKSILELKSELSASLRALTAPIVVVLDDIDRLTKSEVRLLFRLIKANGDLPRIIYVLLCDRAVVEDAMDAEVPGKGGKYVEKIVQAGFDLPAVSHQQVLLLLEDGLGKELTKIGVHEEWKEGRWLAILEEIGPLFRTVREVKRFLSTFSFTVGLFIVDGHLEVDINDCIALEALRVFEPALHRQLAENQDLLLGKIRPNDDNESLQYQQSRLDTLLGYCSTDNRDICQNALSALFPFIEQLLDGHIGSNRNYALWRQSRRILLRSGISTLFPTGPSGGPIFLRRQYLAYLKQVHRRYVRGLRLMSGPDCFRPRYSCLPTKLPLQGPSN